MNAASRSFDGYQSNQIAKVQYRNPMVGATDDKGQNVGALRDQIETVFTHGMSKLYDEEQMELQKLNAINKQIAIEEEQLTIQKIQERQRQGEKMLKQLRKEKQDIVLGGSTYADLSPEKPAQSQSAKKPPIVLPNKLTVRGD